MATTISKAQLHKSLQKFRDEVKRGFVERECVVRGIKLTLRTPNDDAECWADQFTQSTPILAFVSSRRVPRLACAIVMFEGSTPADLFPRPSDVSEDAWKALQANESQYRHWLWGQMRTFLTDEIPSPVIQEMYIQYEKLMDERDAALKEVIEAGPNV